MVELIQQYEVLIQLLLLGAIIMAGPLVILVLYLRGADM
jgi:hypothetical protein